MQRSHQLILTTCAQTNSPSASKKSPQKSKREGHVVVKASVMSAGLCLFCFVCLFMSVFDFFPFFKNNNNNNGPGRKYSPQCVEASL